MLVFLANLGATLAMAGLIWVVQMVHYPLFARVGPSHFTDYHRLHVRQMTWVVAPLMLLEAVTTALLVAAPPEGIPVLATASGAVLLLCAWLSTAMLQVPFHDDLSRGFDGAVHRWLVGSNWLRTAAWTARALLVLWMTARLLP